MTSPATSTRRPALDALRGVAALVVVVHHCLLISPTLAAGYGGTRPHPAAGTWGWWLLYTPLHVFWAGGEAVVIFFVLSGLVLALPSASGLGVRWRAYYPARLLRLYLPIAGAVVFALVMIHLVRRTPSASSSWWLAAHGPTASHPEVVRDLEIVQGTNLLNSSLWSLQWEIVFSMLLPVFILVLVRLRGFTVLRLGLVVAVLIDSSFSTHTALTYLPMFAVGVLMAQHIGWLDRVGLLLGGIARRAFIAVGAVLLLLVPWLLQSFPSTLELESRWENAGGLVVEVTGAALLVWLTGCTGLGHALVWSRALRWLGARSFSLYLVHEPIVVTVTYALGGTTDAALVLVIALPLSLVMAEVFERLVELPAHRLSRLVGRRAGGLGRGLHATA